MRYLATLLYTQLYLCTLLSTTAIAQVTFTCHDLNPATGWSNPYGFTICDNKLFYAAHSDSSGFELWVTEGRPVQSHMVKDIWKGIKSGDVASPIAFKNKLYFGASDSLHGEELWVSDGTDTGTYMVKDINPGNATSHPVGIAVHNNRLYLFANTASNGNELWVTDGTDTGTILLKDINPGTAGSATGTVCASYNGKLFFTANDGTHGNELWITDGTASGTTLLKDIFPGSGSSLVKSFRVVNGKLLFSAIDDIHGRELWTTDGTTLGTVLLKDCMPGAAGGFLTEETQIRSIVHNNKLFFQGMDAPGNYELWVSDGTATGTQMLKDIVPGTVGSQPNGFVIYNYKVYFQAGTTTTGTELWETDGTATGTKLSYDIYPKGSYSSYPHDLTVYNNYLYLVAKDSAYEDHIFRYNGTGSGLVKLVPDTVNKFCPLQCPAFEGMIVYDSSLYLNAKYMVSTNEELWSLKDTSLYTPPPPSNIQCIQANSFTLYPNPNNGNFTIELDNINFKECKVEVYDMTRRLIKSEKLISKSETISINQPKGIYLVKVQLDDKALTKQLIVD